MELKFHSERSHLLGHLGSNRTFMELKSTSESGSYEETIVLIVPLWN